MICPNCKTEMLELKIPYMKSKEGVNHMCENEYCNWYGIRRTEIRIKD